MKNRDALLKHCIKRGRSKNPLSDTNLWTESSKIFKTQKRYFKISDLHAKNIMGFPCDQYLSKSEMNYVVNTVKEFYDN